MLPYPREEYHGLARYLPDRSPIAVDLADNRNLWGAHPDAVAVIERAVSESLSQYPGTYAQDLVAAVAGILAIWTFVAMLKKKSFHRFAPYCWAVGCLFLGYLFLRG